MFVDWQEFSEFSSIILGFAEKDRMQTIIEYTDIKDAINIYIFWSVLHSNFLIKTQKPSIQQIIFIILELSSKSFKLWKKFKLVQLP